MDSPITLRALFLVSLTFSMLVFSLGQKQELDQTLSRWNKLNLEGFKIKLAGLSDEDWRQRLADMHQVEQLEGFSKFMNHLLQDSALPYLDSKSMPLYEYLIKSKELNKNNSHLTLSSKTLVDDLLQLLKSPSENGCSAQHLEKIYNILYTLSDYESANERIRQHLIRFCTNCWNRYHHMITSGMNLIGDDKLGFIENIAQEIDIVDESIFEKLSYSFDLTKLNLVIESVANHVKNSDILEINNSNLNMLYDIDIEEPCEYILDLNLDTFENFIIFKRFSNELGNQAKEGPMMSHWLKSISLCKLLVGEEHKIYMKNIIYSKILESNH